MGLRAERLLRRAGAVSILALGVSLLTLGMLPVQAAAHHAKSAPSAPACAHQPNLNDPTNSDSKVLDSYWFAVQHAGQTTTVCTLFGNVSSGDIVTAHFTVDPAAAPTPGAAGPEITLVSNTASSSSAQQTLFDCASFSVGADPDTPGDPCLGSTEQVLTVHVPDCAFQVDLIYGEPLATMTIGQYRTDHRWVDGQVGNRSSTCTSPTPTPTPTPTASASPSPTPAGGVQGITTPGTGSGGSMLPLAGLALIGLGIGAIVRSSRRWPAGPTP